MFKDKHCCGPSPFPLPNDSFEERKNIKQVTIDRYEAQNNFHNNKRHKAPQ